MYKTGLHPVDVSGLNHILDIDSEKLVAHVEGQVTMGELCKATLPLGLLPAVVPEFKQFTVSGLINGEGIQSSSHRHGVFTHTLISVELLAADGRVITATAEQNADVFAAMSESLGTLGMVTAATIKLVHAKNYVKCTYRVFPSRSEYISAFTSSLGKTAFHEGIIFGPRGYVLLTGEFIDSPDGLEVFDSDVDGGEYFYQHVRKSASTRTETVEAMETLKYLTRLERGMWWLLDCHADFPLLSETSWGRRHMDKVATDIYNKKGFISNNLTTAERDRCLINQDMGVKIDQLEEGVKWVQSRLEVYPLWNCAVKQPDPAQFQTEYLVDIGIYGEPMAPDYHNVRDMRALQQRVPAPSLWGVSYLTWDEIVAHAPERFSRYESVRKKLNASDAFLHMKDKVVWVDPSTADPGKLAWWRLYRTFGPNFWYKPSVYLLLLVVHLARLIWRKPTM